MENYKNRIVDFFGLTIRPMSLFESGESNGRGSLESLFSSQQKILEKNELNLNDIAFLICRGGWPMAVICLAIQFWGLVPLATGKLPK